MSTATVELAPVDLPLTLVPAPTHDDPVWIDEDGLLHNGSAWVALPDVEWRLMSLFVARKGQLVRREDLAAAGWPERSATAGSLNVHIRRIRRRVRPLGLTITTVRGRGYVLS